MDVAEKNGVNERSTVLLGVLAFLIIGLSLMATMWNTFAQQEQASGQHLFLTARSLLHAVESSFRLTQSGIRSGISPVAAEFFRELEASGDVLFVGLIDPSGAKILSGRMTQDTGALSLPKEALEEMPEATEWQGMAHLGSRPAYVYAKRVMPVREREPYHGGRGRMRDKNGNLMRQGYLPVSPDERTPMEGPGDFLEDEVQLVKPGDPIFLVVAMDIARYEKVYEDFRKSAFFQTVYVLAAAVVAWILGMSFLKRRKLAGRAVELERFQARLLDNLPDGLVIISRDNTISGANPAAHRILGVQNGPLVGQKLSDLPRQVASSLEVKGSSGRWRHLDEGGLHLEILSLPFREDEQQEDEGLCIIRDRTEIHQLEKSLSEVEKLAAVGTLAAGVAHEIRNPLSALRGFAQYFAKKLVGRQPDETYAQTMVREADRLNRVVTDLLYLARPRPIAPRPLELAVLVADLEHMLRLDVESGKVRFGVTLECPSVTADEDALKQALLNLILNSLEAVADLPEEERSIILASRRDDEAGGVWIMVSDNGCGMSQTVKGQAFEPFFTTRKKGTGLGLALVLRTIKEHNGRINLESAPNQGTTVSLFLPDQPGGVDSSTEAA